MYLLISLLVLIISFKLFKTASGSMLLTKLNMVSFIFYLQLVIYSWIGSILVLYTIDGHYIISRISDDSIRFWGWLSVMYTMIFLPLGILFSKLFFSKSLTSNSLSEYSNKEFTNSLSPKDSYIKVFLYILSAFSFLTYIYLLYYIKEIGIVKMIRGGDSILMTMFRISISRNFQGNQYLVNIFGLAITPILGFISYSYYKLSKSNTDKYWCIIMVLLSVLYLTYNLEKGPVINFILGFLFLRVVVSGDIPKSWLYLTLISIVSLLVVFYVLLSSEVDVLSLFKYNSGIGGRILLSQLSGMYECFDNFPRLHDHLGFSSLSEQFSNILGINYNERAARINMQILYPDAVKSGLVGVGNTLFIGEAWANFGIIGVLLSPLYVGFCLGLIYYYIMIKCKKTPVVLGIYAYFCVFSSVTGGFNDFIYSPIIFVTILVFVLIKSLAYTIKKYNNVKK